MNHREVYNIASHCSAMGIHRAVISPGSRNALLMIAFARHPEIECHVVADERSAAFTALGLSQGSGEPVALCCTSGTAGVNFAPAVIEAYYTNTPLIVFTADRPPEWIDQLDGQTIRQEGLYGKHIKFETTLKVDTRLESGKTSFLENLHTGLQEALKFPKGPVHFNVPIREPFYSSLPLSFESSDFLDPGEHAELSGVQEVVEAVKTSGKVLIIPGQSRPDKTLQNEIYRISRYGNIAVISDHIANSGYTDSVHHDLWLPHLTEDQKEELRPDVIISFGLSIISKSLKQLLRSYPDVTHYNFNSTLFDPDPFNNITHRFNQSPNSTLRLVEGKQGNYKNLWRSIDLKVEVILQYKLPYSEFSAFQQIAKETNGFDILHVSNSMPVRYSNFFSYSPSMEVYSNRGTSGIDGCTSTAIGFALADSRNHLLVTGDIAFFYDINAFWKERLPGNLKIVVINNGGGAIFRVIPGPSDQPELERFFETRHTRNASHLCSEYQIPYFTCHNEEELLQKWQTFKNEEGIALLEVFIDPKSSTQTFNQLKERVREDIRSTVG